MKLSLTPRLAAAAEFAESGTFVADIGTDHAYLPIWLCLNRGIKGALASDVKRGPIERAEENIAKYGLCDKISTTLACGLEGIEKYRPDTVFICGMGGDLIYELIEASEYVRTNRTKLVLQPMTHQSNLRICLANGGYRIIGEKIVSEGDKIYQIICAIYDGEKRTLSQELALVGEINLQNREKDFFSHLQNQINLLEKKIDGLKRSGRDASIFIAIKNNLEGYR